MLWKNLDDYHTKDISQSEIIVLHESLGILETNTSTDLLERTDSTTNVEKPSAHKTPMVDSHLKTTHGEGNMENKLRETAVNKDKCEIGSDQLTEDILKVPVHLLKEEIVQGKVLYHAGEHLLGEADHNEKPSCYSLKGLVNSVVSNDHTKDNREEKPSGYSLKGSIDSVVNNDH